MKYPACISLAAVVISFGISTPLSHAACSSGSTIVALSTLGGTSHSVEALAVNGLMTGFSYLPGGTQAHAFLAGPKGIVDLGTLDGSVSQGFAINAAGQVAGESSFGYETHAFLYSGSSMIDLGTLGGSISSASAINGRGDVVGYSYLWGNWDLEAFLYRNGQMQGLGSLGGGSSYAVGINESGLVAGNSYTADYYQRGFLWAEGVISDIGDLGGGYSLIADLNAEGAVAGESYDESGNLHAFLYAGGTMLDLGTLGGTESGATALNDLGQVIGWWRTPKGAEGAFIYSNGGMTDLGSLGGTYVSAAAIDYAGHVVGAASTENETALHAFIWQDGEMTDLNTFLPEGSGWELRSAEHIADDGTIVGYGTFNGLFTWFAIQPGSGTQNQPPLVAPGTSQTIECTASAVLDGSASTDPDGDALTFQWISGGAVLGSAPVLTASFPLGSHSVTLTVTDPCGAAAQSVFSVTVVDTTPPVFLQVPASVTGEVNEGCAAAVPNLLERVIATDGCGGSAVTLSQTPAPGETVPAGIHSVTVTATDALGNAAIRTVELTAGDKARPVVQSITATPAVIPVPNGKLTLVTCTVAATDNCDPAPVSRIIEVSCNEPIGPDDVLITGNLTVELRADRDPRGEGRTYEITVETVDASGNVTTAVTTVTVPRSKPKGNLPGRLRADPAGRNSRV